MADIESDLVVLGAGPGGYAAAFLGADRGLKVTLIDAAERPGGACLFVGCIPSKALLHVARTLFEAREATAWGVDFGKPQINLDGVRGNARKIVDTMSRNLLGLCKQRKVDFVNARGSFSDANTLELSNGTRHRFKNCIIATGSSPTRIPSLSLDSPRIMDSTGALKLEEVPKTLLVVGGGYIGLELGTVYAALGSSVTVVELTDGLLPGVDRDLVRPLQGRLEKLFTKIFLSSKVLKLQETKNGIKATLEGEQVEDKEPVFDRVLVAVGRRPNSKDIGLERAGVQLDEKGFIRVDAQRRTSIKHIYAIGDVAGEPMLAHKASHEGKTAVEAILGEPAAFEPRAIPAVVFTDPEIAWCGLTENDAKKQNREVKVARFPWAASGRAYTVGRTEGLTKVVFDPETEIVLGVGIVGTMADDLISEGVLAVEMAATAQDLSLTIHPHPTLSETLGEAADVLRGTATDIYRPKK
jgi:dihydrolipoamide dehydrogenase